MHKRKKISVLGSGWLGLPLAKSLKKDNQTIHLSTRSESKIELLKNLNMSTYQVDIEALTDDVQAFLQTDILIINITCKRLEAYQKLLTEIEKSSIQHVLFISSTSVYPSHQGKCKESDVINSMTNLHAIENVFIKNNHFDCTIIRFAGLIGPKRHPGRFFSTGKSVKDANAKVNLIHQDDCIKLIKTILEQNAWGEVFNGCADNHPTKHAYYSQMAASLGYEEPHCIVAEKSSTKTICNEKVKEVLGYQFIYPDIYLIDW